MIGRNAIVAEPAALYLFELDEAEFSERGLDAKVGLDRYSVPDLEAENYRPGDKVVAIVGKRDEKEIATIVRTDRERRKFLIETAAGETREIDWELAIKPLETRPSQWWRRFSTALAVEDSKGDPKLFLERLNDFRWMTDRFRVSFGGRVMLALGQEYVGITDEEILEAVRSGKVPPPKRPKAALTAYNCYVGENPKGATGYWNGVEKVSVYDDILAEKVLSGGRSDDREVAVRQFINVLENALKEANIMRRGGGYGINISHIETVRGAGTRKEDIVIYIPKGHRDYREALKRKAIGKFGVYATVIHEPHQLQDVPGWEGLGDDFVYILVEDSVEGMFHDMGTMIRSAFAGKKVFLDFTNVRHRNAIVRGINGRSSGSVSWAEMFEQWARLLSLDVVDCVEFAEIPSAVVHLIQQGGSRRGALMLVLESYRRDVLLKFVGRKRELDHLGNGRWLTGANISVGVDETFMGIVKGVDEEVSAEMEIIAKEKGLDLSTAAGADAAYREAVDRVLSNTGGIAGEVYGAWVEIVRSAWSSAEPGIIWLERYNNLSNSWYFNEIVATNPCGEQGLPPWGVCNLGHITLPNFWDRSARRMNWRDLRRAVKLGIRAQDIIVDYTPYFLEENRRVQMMERRVGQGTMGLGSLLLMAGIRYGAEATEFIDELFARISFWQVEASMELAREKGPFPAFDADRFLASGHMRAIVERWKRVLPADEFDVDGLVSAIRAHGVRNVTVSTQAPTGSTGTMLDFFFKNLGWFDMTTGIEPIFAYEYSRASRLGVDSVEVMAVQQWRREHPGEPLPRHFVCAMDGSLTPEDHIMVQAAVQRWTDSSISKTANCPSEYTPYQTHLLYMMAYDQGLKGMTIYRDGSRSAQVLATDPEKARLESQIEADAMAAASPEPFQFADHGHFKKCPECGEIAYDKANCICHACGTSTCAI